MTENREETAMVDRMLEQMAQETPEMPADFHARWTQAIREEAGDQSRTEKHREGRRQLRYILSAAAVFVFLIGGTLLTRSMNRTDSVNGAAVTVAPATEDGVGEAAPADPDIRAAEQENAEAPGLDVPDPQEPAMYAAMEEDAGTAAEAPLAEAPAAAAEVWGAAQSAKSASQDSVKAAGNAAMIDRTDLASTSASEADSVSAWASEADMAMAPEMESAMEEYEEEAEAEEYAEETAAPTATPTAEPTAEPTAAPAEESEFVSFLRDFGIFTLKTLAVAAVIAVLFFGGKAVYQAARKRKNGKG